MTCACAESFTCTICGVRRWCSAGTPVLSQLPLLALVAEALQFRRRRGGKFVKLAVPSRASARGDGADHHLFQIARLRFRFRNLTHSEIAAAFEFANVRAGRGIARIRRDAEPDVGSEPILWNAAAIFQCFGIEV